MFDFVTRDIVVSGMLPALAVATVLVVVQRARRADGPVPVGGVVTCLLLAYALRDGGDPYRELWAGVAIAAGGSIAVSLLSRSVRSKWMAVLHVAAVVPGAALAVRIVAIEAAAWMEVLAVCSAAVAGAATDRFASAHSRGSGPFLMLLGAVAAVWLTVPETGTYSYVMVISVVLVSVTWPWQLVSLGPGGGTAVLTFVAALAVESGEARPGAVIGGLSVAGVLMLGLLGTRIAELDSPKWTPSAYKIVGLQAGVTFLVVRVAGLRESSYVAAVLVAAVYAAGWYVFVRMSSHSESNATEVGS